MNPVVFADLHTHTRLCRHAEDEPLTYVAHAAKNGLKVIGISDHFPAPMGYDAKYRMRAEEWSDYCAMFLRAKELGEKLGIEVLFSAEYDFVPGRMNEVEDFLERVQHDTGIRFDYLIGSVHYVDDFAFDDPDKIQEWEIRGVDDIWEQYLDLLQQFTEECNFSVMAHPDLPKKFGFHHSDSNYVIRRFRAIFKEAVKKNICVELNTAGWRVQANEIYPNNEILQSAKNAGMKITFGSDAHAPVLVGYKIHEACEIARKTGWKNACFFRKGKPIDYSISDYRGLYQS